MDNSKTIGGTLKKIRESLNIKPSELAETADVTPSYIYQVEGDTQMPSSEYLDTLIKIYVSKSNEPPEDKVRRITELIEMTKSQYIEKNQLRIRKKAERRYDVLYELVSEN